jgi:hypothetical protein
MTALFVHAGQQPKSFQHQLNPKIMSGIKDLFSLCYWLNNKKVYLLDAINGSDAGKTENYVSPTTVLSKQRVIGKLRGARK